MLDGRELFHCEGSRILRQTLVLEREELRIGILVGHVRGLDHGLEELPVAEDEEGHFKEYVRWVLDGPGLTGLIDPSALCVRVQDLFIEERSQMGEGICPSAF